MEREGRLMERVIERDNLRLGFWKAARGRRTKRDAVLFATRLDENLDLRKRYVPAATSATWTTSWSGATTGAGCG